MMTSKQRSDQPLDARSAKTPENNRPAFHVLKGDHLSAIIDLRGSLPALLYLGRHLSAETTPAMLAHFDERYEVPGGPAIDAPLSLSPTHAAGWLGAAAISLHQGGCGWDFNPRWDRIKTDEIAGGQALMITASDPRLGLMIIHRLAMIGDILKASTEIRNQSAEPEPFVIDHCAAITIPVPDPLDHILSFEGRWAGEFQMRTTKGFMGQFVRENRRGRTSHDSFPALILKESTTDYHRGSALAIHLGWSGNHRLIHGQLPDGRCYLQAGSLFLPGEIRLAPGEHYQSPDVFISISDQGLNGLSAHFHHFVRHSLLSPGLKNMPRKVHYNSWEAVYFQHDLKTLCQLADEAAAVGAERFVLDDGWFLGRRHDRAGLGDWFVDPAIYPDGLGPLIDHVHEKGMDFGLWVEPEMVNPDSDLFRAHPDWVLAASGADPIPFRHQLCLDLSHGDVSAMLFSRLDDLLKTYPIAYLKWDMNRDNLHPGGAMGEPVMERQIHALYALLDRLRAAHPKVEIESCASGGGRADYGILARTDRIWTSDSNDAMDRLAIQRGFSLFFPPEVMGAHVGPHLCHITKRAFPMETRAAVALFGHMGIEADLRQETPADKAILAQAIALYKRTRGLIHSGQLVRFDSPAPFDAFAMIEDGGGQALVSIAHLGHDLAASSLAPTSLPPKIRFSGLEPHRTYQMRALWPQNPDPGNSAFWAELFDGGITASGAVLMQSGLLPPRMMPHSLLILHLQAI
ncbi:MULTISPECIES: alpha-galactosidase [unclassified Iodidimonas]|uniref:alpha-galactosidase n=2 Tax=Iodidimonas TaxID=2066486 RepID=UPI002482769D|nr:MULTISPECIES: alpha-galactosidase [unclassified Iodidimonas]